jgi:type IX secretion system PorP/SprF family membrane protein
MNRKTLCILFLFYCFYSSYRVRAQDPQFSQFYASPLYLSPSFAGSTDGSRLITNFRDQWPSIPGSFITFAASFDHFIPQLSSGVGVLFMRDQAGRGHLGNTNIGVLYSYQFRVGKRWQVRPGMQFYRCSRHIDFNKLVFNDQMSLSGTTPSSVEVPPLKTVSYTDFAASLLIYSEKYWGGFVIDHLTTPNQSIIDGVSPIPVKYTIHGGYKSYLNGKTSSYNEESITTAFNFRSQGKFDQLDFGLYWTRLPIILGAWYRGIPLFKAYKRGYQNNDAVIILIGYQWKEIKLGYTYDVTISRLIANTFGSHEVSIIYEFNQNQKVRKKTRKIIIPCPKF